jgi:hypothetical protein
MARAPVTLAKPVRIRVHEFRFAARDGRPFRVHEAAIDRERRRLGFASHCDRFLDRQVPRMIEIEIRNRSRETIRVGEARGGIAGSVARDRQRLRDGRVDRIGREVRGAGMAAPLPDEHRNADALVAVIRDGLDFAVSDGDTLTDGLRHFGLCRRCAAGTCGTKHRFGHSLQLGSRQRKALALSPGM